MPVIKNLLLILASSSALQSSNLHGYQAPSVSTVDLHNSATVDLRDPRDSAYSVPMVEDDELAVASSTAVPTVDLHDPRDSAFSGSKVSAGISVPTGYGDEPKQDSPAYIRKHIIEFFEKEAPPGVHKSTLLIAIDKIIDIFNTDFAGRESELVEMLKHMDQRMSHMDSSSKLELLRTLSKPDLLRYSSPAYLNLNSEDPFGKLNGYDDDLEKKDHSQDEYLNLNSEDPFGKLNGYDDDLEKKGIVPVQKHAIAEVDKRLRGNAATATTPADTVTATAEDATSNLTQKTGLYEGADKNTFLYAFIGVACTLFVLAVVGIVYRHRSSDHSGDEEPIFRVTIGGERTQVPSSSDCSNMRVVQSAAIAQV